MSIPQLQHCGQPDGQKGPDNHSQRRVATCGRNPQQQLLMMGRPRHPQDCTPPHLPYNLHIISYNIFHKNREIPILTMKKNNKANTSSGSHRKNQTRGEKKKNKKPKKKKHTSGMNKSASLTPVQEPSTVVCMIVT